LLLRCPFLGEAARVRLRSLLAALEGISPVTLAAEVFRRARAGPVEYRSLLEVCRLVSEGLQPAAGSGQPGTAFLIDLEVLFERHVIRGIRAAFAGSGFTVEEQPLLHVEEQETGNPAVRMRPDVVIREGEQARLVLDAKWKRLPPGRAHPADLYQVLAYGSVLEARQLALVHPGRRNACRRLRLPGEGSVQLHALRMTASPAECERSLKQLGDKLLASVQT